jgi:hypothetical protein
MHFQFLNFLFLTIFMAEISTRKTDQKFEILISMLKPNMIKVRSNVVRNLIICMGSTMKLSNMLLARLNSNR